MNEAKAREALEELVRLADLSPIQNENVMQAADATIKAAALAAHVEICLYLYRKYNTGQWLIKYCGDGWYCPLAREKYIEGSEG